jgi:hypothetical protein
MNVGVEVPGERASVRLTAGEAQAFVLGLRWALPEPFPSNAAMATLKRLEVKKGKREYVGMDFTTYGGLVTKSSASGQADQPLGIPLNSSRYDTQSVRIEPRSPLPPGEYAFITLSATTDPYKPANEFTLFCFGVD